MAFLTWVKVSLLQALQLQILFVHSKVLGIALIHPEKGKGKPFSYHHQKHQVLQLMINRYYLPLQQRNNSLNQN